MTNPNNQPIIDLTNPEVNINPNIDDAIPHLPIDLDGKPHRTIGVARDGDVLAYPTGGKHGEEIKPVWIDPTGKKVDQHGLTRAQRNTIQFAKNLPIFCPDDTQRVRRFKEMDPVLLCNAMLGVHSALIPQVDPNPTSEQTVIYKNEPGKTSIVVDELPIPQNRYALIEVVSKMINSVAERAKSVESPSDESNQAALIRIANLIGLLTVIAHPFEDGNGRTSRALAYLTRFGIPRTAEELHLFGVISQKSPEAGDPIPYQVTTIRPVIKPDRPNIKSWQDAINFAASPKIALTKEGQEQYETEHSQHFKTLFDNRIFKID